jgi:predicted ester cyclase
MVPGYVRRKQMTDVLEPKAVVRAIVAARQDNDLEAGLRFIAPESLDQGQPATRGDWRRKWEQMRAGCPDMEVITEHSVEDGEWAANRYTIRGTHTGDFFGQPPTGQRFEIRGMDMVRVRGGQLIEHWAFAEPLPAR